MDIFYRSVVHSTVMAGFWIQCWFKNCTKNCRRNILPVEITFFQKQRFEFFIKSWNKVVCFRKKISVHIRKLWKFFIQVKEFFVSFFIFHIQNCKKLFYAFTKIFGRITFHKRMKHSFFSKKFCIVCIKHKNQTDTKHVETALMSRRVVVFYCKNFIKFINDFSGFHRKSHFFFYFFFSCIVKHWKVVKFIRQIFKLDYIRLAVLIFHIMNFKRHKIRNNNPSRSFRITLVVSITVCLLEWSQILSVRLKLSLWQIDFRCFLFN